MCSVTIWPKSPPTWKDEALKLLLQDSIQEPDNVKLDHIIKNSEKFPIKFPIETVRCKALKNINNNMLERNINSTYPLIHENALYLFAQFILHKRLHGNALEKELYKDMTILKLVERLLTKRAVMFMGKFDSYLLLDGTKGAGKWDRIKINKETEKLNMKNCISYDEIKLSVFLSVSSYSHFINNGSRKNKGIPATTRNDLQAEGVIIGLIGARMKKIKAMEYEEMVITKNQNVEAFVQPTSLYSLFRRFYEEPTYTYKYVVDHKHEEKERFTEVNGSEYFDNVCYAKRMALSIDTLLVEANERAREKQLFAYIHVVGIGLGVWKCSPHQEEVFLNTFANRIEYLAPHLNAVSDIYFAYFGRAKLCGKYKDGDVIPIKSHPKKGIKIYISKREPHTKLTGEHASKLLIVSYAWDGNAFPGNEFWSGKLASTGDSAAAASTQITELHNPCINPKVCAGNLKLVTTKGVIPFGKYREEFQGKKSRKRSRDEGEHSKSKK